ncbi:MAG: DUF2828 family protein [Methylococcales bacterium]
MFTKALTSTATTTENGAKSHGSTGSKRVDYFFKVLRSTPQESINSLLSGAHNESPEDAIKLVFQLRDCRGGKGERDATTRSLKWYMNNGHIDIVRSYLKFLPYFGYWKDLHNFFGTDLESDVISLFAEIITKDIARLKKAKDANDVNEDGDLNVSITLAGKYIPSEKSKMDLKFSAAKKIAKCLGVTMSVYRKEYITPLRNHIKIVETYMCAKQWDTIKYGQVPSVCMMKHRKAFTRNDTNRFEEFIKSVEKGDETINATQLFPHQLVHDYISKRAGSDPVINAQWEALVTHFKAQGSLGNSIAVCDVSGSMTCDLGKKSGYQAIDASIGLSLLMAECAPKPFQSLISFSSKPEFMELKGDNLYQRITNISKNNWTMNTDFQAVFEMILERAKGYTYFDEETKTMKNGIPVDQMPTSIFVFSDMQFDRTRFCRNCNPTDNEVRNGWGYAVNACKCVGSGQISNLDAVRVKYASAGYPMPQMVFWNLNGKTLDFPATSDESGIALVSGYSPSLMKLFMTGASMNPYNVMRGAIDDTRYDLISKKHIEMTLEDIYYNSGVESKVDESDVKRIKL